MFQILHEFERISNIDILAKLKETLTSYASKILKSGEEQGLTAIATCEKQSLHTATCDTGKFFNQNSLKCKSYMLFNSKMLEK